MSFSKWDKRMVPYSMQWGFKKACTMYVYRFFFFFVGNCHWSPNILQKIQILYRIFQQTFTLSIIKVIVINYHPTCWQGNNYKLLPVVKVITINSHPSICQGNYYTIIDFAVFDLSTWPGEYMFLKVDKPDSSLFQSQWIFYFMKTR